MDHSNLVLTIETGIRVPLIANWPGYIKEGVVSNDMIDAVDFLLTILEAAGKPSPDDVLTDGQSFLPKLKGNPMIRRDWIYMHYNLKPGWGKDQFAPSEFVMDRNHKLYEALNCLQARQREAIALFYY